VPAICVDPKSRVGSEDTITLTQVNGQDIPMDKTIRNLDELSVEMNVTVR